MAEENQDKFSLPIAGVVALVAMAGAVIFYQTPLKTSRPIDQEAEKKAGSQERVQSRLWQDPFEAVQTHRLKELERYNIDKAYQDAYQEDSQRLLQAIHRPLFVDLIKSIKGGRESVSFRILPVFVDGSPYANGLESRLKDRYALVSALGAAGYMPESGEYIRYFEWPRPTRLKMGSNIIIPIERFKPKAKIRMQDQHAQDVLVLWLKEQDFQEMPLVLMNELISHLKNGLSLSNEKANNKVSKESSYSILGPRYSGTLTAMVRELSGHERECADGDNRNGSSDKTNLSDLKGITFYSYWPTVNDNFLLDCLPDYSQRQRENTVEGLFSREGIEFIRTIGSDAVLAGQLVNELGRRGVNIIAEEADKSCKPTIALISAWDTIYGRTLPRIFAAVAENMARHGGEMNSADLDGYINKLRRDEWPGRIVRYSYLAGLDGELPPKKESDGAAKAKDKENVDSKDPAVRRVLEKVAEGRDQLDYLQRMVVDLKMIEDGFNDDSEDCDHKSKSISTRLLEKKKGFKAIGVLGSDVYDKLLILQALKKEFPQAIFFTIDLDARLLHPEHREWTRNLVVASNFGLQLHPELQSNIPPFRDNSQTALFYSVFRALGYLYDVRGPLPNIQQNLISRNRIPQCFPPDSPDDANAIPMPKKEGCFSTEIKPKLYEIGRNTAVDISTDLQSPSEFKSIHPVRPDSDEGGLKGPVRMETIIWVSTALVVLGITAMLISSDIEMFVIKNPLKNPLKNTLKNPFTPKVYFVISIPIILGALEWGARKSDGVEGEPYTLTQGVSIWPAVALQLLAVGLCIRLYFYARDDLLKKQDREVSKKFGLPGPGTTAEVKVGQDFWDLYFSIPRWHEIKSEANNKTKNEADVAGLWKEYRELRGAKYSLRRIGAQFMFIFALAWLLWLKIGFPPTPCRGPACFLIYDSLTFLSSVLLVLWMLYVIDTSRLCRRFITILCEKKFSWPSESKRINNESHLLAVDRSYLNELACINLIGEWTAVVSKLLYFPFIILFLLTIARYNYIDNFAWTMWLMLIYGFIAAYAAGVVIALRVTAEKARKRATEQLEKKLSSDFSPHLSCSLSREEQKRQIDQVIQRIKNNQQGAFMPFAKYPVLGALALPAGGTGLLYLIDYLVQSF